ncbi:heme-binding protein [Pseudarthrobacter sp. C4D7]|uniref:SOUL family heme-binding protein n=1 Tax=Pseudarthrobacter sp. C4D7 TaxID=2735268 RepID=UPI00158498AE|nr:heme-binding protein [Pseudarthrobacter sp. C4D7]NUT73138.1 heme-binding protein [Pseudarthrobacter sp. C4D7]
MTEQQPFELVRRYPHFELRRYPDYVVAEVTVNADFDRAGNAAFRYLFNYISGSNTARQKLAMTAPVLQEAGAEKLAMTTPVLQSGPLPGAGQPAEFSVAFVLPAGVSAETAPVPNDPKVRVRAVPGSLAAVQAFSGSGSAAAFERRNNGLQAALLLAGLTPVGAPRFARFDPPFKPWFLRHNEVVQDVAEPRAGGAAPAP